MTAALPTKKCVLPNIIKILHPLLIIISTICNIFLHIFITPMCQLGTEHAGCFVLLQLVISFMRKFQDLAFSPFFFFYKDAEINVEYD